MLSGGTFLQQEKLRGNKRKLKGEKKKGLQVAGFLEQFCV